MQRSFERKRRLPAFACDLAECEALVQEISDAFKPLNSEPKFSFEIDLPGEMLEFESLDETRKFAGLPKTVRKFSLTWNDWKIRGRCHLEINYYSDAHVTVSGPSQAWCAGLTDLALGFAQRHRVWYWWLSERLVWLAILIVLLTPVPTLFKNPQASIDLGTAIAYLLTIIMLVALLLSFIRVFPSGRLRIRTESSFLGRYNSELTLLAAIVAAIAAVLALIFG